MSVWYSVWRRARQHHSILLEAQALDPPDGTQNPLLIFRTEALDPSTYHEYAKPNPKPPTEVKLHLIYQAIDPRKPLAYRSLRRPFCMLFQRPSFQKPSEALLHALPETLQNSKAPLQASAAPLAAQPSKPLTAPLPKKKKNYKRIPDTPSESEL